MSVETVGVRRPEKMIMKSWRESRLVSKKISSDVVEHPNLASNHPTGTKQELAGTWRERRAGRSLKPQAQWLANDACSH